MSTFQAITLPVLGLLVIGAAVATVRHHVTRRVGMAWMVIWLSAAVSIADPALLVRVARWAGIGRAADLVLYLSVLFTLAALFAIYLRFRRIDEQLTRIVRHLAIEEAESKMDKTA